MEPLGQWHAANEHQVSVAGTHSGMTFSGGAVKATRPCQNGDIVAGFRRTRLVGSNQWKPKLTIFIAFCLNIYGALEY